MRIGFIATRLNGTDGVSLEVEKWAQVLQRLGHEIYYCAGELGGYARGGSLIPELHFAHQSIFRLSKQAFESGDQVDVETGSVQVASQSAVGLRHLTGP